MPTRPCRERICPHLLEERSCANKQASIRLIVCLQSEWLIGLSPGCCPCAQEDPHASPPSDTLLLIKRHLES